MAHVEDITQLRKRFVEAMESGAIPAGEGSSILQATLIQIMNEAETRRQTHVAAALRARELAVAEENQAKAYSSIGSVVFNVLNGFIDKAEQAEEEASEKNEVK